MVVEEVVLGGRVVVEVVVVVASVVVEVVGAVVEVVVVDEVVVDEVEVVGVEEEVDPKYPQAGRLKFCTPTKTSLPTGCAP